MARRRSRLTSLRIAVLLGVALSCLRFTAGSVIETLDARAVDLRLRYRGPQQASSAVVIVAIDDASIERIGRWPWPRSTMSRLVDAVALARPSVIGFDVVQSEESVAPILRALRDRVDGLDDAAWTNVETALRQWSEEDRALAESVRRAGNVVLGYYFDPGARSRLATPPPTFSAVKNRGGERGLRRVPEIGGAVRNLPILVEAAKSSGFFNVFPDPRDGVFRRVPMALRDGDTVAMPLSLAMLRVHSGDAPTLLSVAPFGADYAKVGDRVIALSEDGRMMLNYRGPRHSFAHVSAADVLEGRVEAERLRGKLALVGVTAGAVADVRATPFDGMLPGVEIHATAIDNVLRGDYLRKPEVFVTFEIAVVLAAALALGGILNHARGVTGALAAAAILLAYLGGSQALFASAGYVLGLVFPVGSIVFIYIVVGLQQFATERGEKKRVRNAFARYVAPEVARRVSEDARMLTLSGERRCLTVLFADVRGFTTISEQTPPDQLVEMVNEYLGAMTEVVFAHDGTLDKYIGDAVMAFWGAPMECTKQAELACLAAIEMVERSRALAETWVARGWPRIEIGIGIHTGDVVVGNFGSDQRLTYTAIGDGVNLASRLESLSKRYGVRMIASEDTVLAAGPAVVVREIDKVRVRGRSEATRIYEILGRGQERERWTLRIERFARGLDAYRSRRWDEAREVFESVLDEHPDDAPARLYLKRCEIYPIREPGPTWDATAAAD